MQTRRRNAWRDKSGRILCGVTTRGAGHKTFPRLFFDASPHGIPGQSIEASPSTRIFPSIRDPPIRYRSLAVSEHPLHSSPSSSSASGIDGREHCEGTRGYAVALTRVYTYDFSIGPRDIFPSLRLPPSLPSTPSSAALLLAILFPIGPRRDSPILIKRISRHQFRVPWSLSRYKLRAAIYPRKLWMFVRISLIPSPKPSSRYFRFLFLSFFPFLRHLIHTWSISNRRCFFQALIGI